MLKASLIASTRSPITWHLLSTTGAQEWDGVSTHVSRSQIIFNSVDGVIKRVAEVANHLFSSQYRALRECGMVCQLTLTSLDSADTGSAVAAVSSRARDARMAANFIFAEDDMERRTGCV